jgi:murein DD-endopeptidase MepM/ murein hydrolase activator NlpD
MAARKAGDGLDKATITGERDVGVGSLVEGWVYPIPDWKGYVATISDGPGDNKRDGGKRGHNGCDLDYRAKSKSDLPQFIARTHQRSSGGLFFCPDGIPVLAARDGVLWSAGNSERGWQVVIDHGKPFATYYQHMIRLFVPLASKGVVADAGLIEIEGKPKAPLGKVHVKAGDVIGLVGADPTQGKTGFNHLHFEVWRDGGADRWIDPTPILAKARHTDFAKVKVPS